MLPLPNCAIREPFTPRLSGLATTGWSAACSASRPGWWRQRSGSPTTVRVGLQRHRLVLLAGLHGRLSVAAVELADEWRRCPRRTERRASCWTIGRSAHAALLREGDVVLADLERQQRCCRRHSARPVAESRLITARITDRSSTDATVAEDSASRERGVAVAGLASRRASTEIDAAGMPSVNGGSCLDGRRRQTARVTSPEWPHRSTVAVCNSRLLPRQTGTWSSPLVSAQCALVF